MARALAVILLFCGAVQSALSLFDDQILAFKEDNAKQRVTNSLHKIIDFSPSSSKPSNLPPPLIGEVDPDELTCALEPPVCSKCRYRSFNGSCNNIHHPTWGMPQTPYGRLLPYNYSDGISAWPVSSTGQPLPNARTISLTLFPETVRPDPMYTLNVQQWGQFITHDMSFALGSTQNGVDSIGCCNNKGQLTSDGATNPQCKPILVSPVDPVHAIFRTKCLQFLRTVTTKDMGCTAPTAPAEPLTAVTAYMDLSQVYGNSVGQASSLREHRGGRMLTVHRGGREWPPQNPDISLGCPSAASYEDPCYLAGDLRVNQNLQLAILHIIMLREHNRIADALAALNPHWTDETVFQEARRIAIAQYQYINYYEYLPILLGSENMVKNKLIHPGVRGYVNDYNCSVDPSVLDEHATAAFRHFHTLIAGLLQMTSEARLPVGILRMSNWFDKPVLLENGTIFEDLTRGLTTQKMDFSDQYLTSEITQFLFKGNNTVGGDLRATDVQRGRDHGLASYTAIRDACGLSVPKTFDEMTDISPKNVLVLKTLYPTPKDVDLVVAGMLERKVPGAQAGPTFLSIITEQFYRTRVGDRFFFENGADPETAFTPSQLKAIRSGASIARLLCDNVDNIKLMQPKAFALIKPTNLLKPCDHLPSIDLSFWKDAEKHENKNENENEHEYEHENEYENEHKKENE